MYSPRASASSITSILRFWILFTAHLAIASIFIIKYGGRYGFDPLLTSLLYCTIILGAAVIYRRRFPAGLLASRRLIIWVIVALTMLLAVFMYQFDAAKSRNGRHTSRQLTIERILRGEYPYQSPASNSHSGFPMWFVLATPFYVIGDSGLIVLMTIPLFAWALWKIDRKYCLPGVMLLVAAPQFLYENAVRSDIMINMTLLFAVFILADSVLRKDGSRHDILAGALTGVALSTRGVAMLVLSAYLGYISVRNPSQALRFGASAAGVFVVSLLPFAVWDWESFVRWGPVAHQTGLSGLPPSLIAISLVMPFFITRRARTFSGFIEATAYLLLLVVTASCLRIVMAVGPQAAIMDSRFDVTYLLLPMPFMIAAMLKLLHHQPARLAPIVYQSKPPERHRSGE